MCSRSASNARSSTGSPLRSTAWPMNAIRSGSPRGPRRTHGQHGRDVDAVGDHAIGAAEEAPARPRRGFGHGDPHVQPVQPPPRAHRVRDVVGDDVLRVAVKRPDERRVDVRQRVPAGDRRDRLVQMDDVEAAAAQLTAQVDHRRRAVGHVRDGAVGREADRPPQRDEPLGQLVARRPRPAMHARGKAVVWIDRRQHAHVVSRGQVLLREGLDVPRHAPRIRPRVRRHQRDAHHGIEPSRTRASFGSPRTYAVTQASTNTPKTSRIGPESLNSAPTIDAASPPASAARHAGDPRSGA